MRPHDHHATDPPAALGACVTVGISHHVIARATGAQLDVVRDWIAGRATPTPAEAERLSALASTAERLARLIKPGHIAAWLATANPTLGGDAPLDRIAADDHRAVAKLVSGLEDPGAS
jgi:hypothetical protein